MWSNIAMMRSRGKSSGFAPEAEQAGRCAASRAAAVHPLQNVRPAVDFVRVPARVVASRSATKPGWPRSPTPSSSALAGAVDLLRAKSALIARGVEVVVASRVLAVAGARSVSSLWLASALCDQRREDHHVRFRAGSSRSSLSLSTPSGWQPHQSRVSACLRRESEHADDLELLGAAATAQHEAAQATRSPEIPRSVSRVDPSTASARRVSGGSAATVSGRRAVLRG